jgi:hypothetical protein
MLVASLLTTSFGTSHCRITSSVKSQFQVNTSKVSEYAPEDCADQDPGNIIALSCQNALQRKICPQSISNFEFAMTSCSLSSPTCNPNDKPDIYKDRVFSGCFEVDKSVEGCSEYTAPYHYDEEMWRRYVNLR